MELGTGIALAGVAISAGTILFKVLPRNGYNKALCEERHKEIERNLLAVNTNLARQQKQLETFASHLDTKYSSLRESMAEIREMVIKLATKLDKSYP